MFLLSFVEIDIILVIIFDFILLMGEVYLLVKIKVIR